MAYKKDIKPWLKENGYTWEDLDEFWEGCVEVNWKCKMIADSGKTWNDLTMYQIQQLPTLKEYTLESIRKREETEKQEAIATQKKKEAEDYYYEHFDELMVRKIDNEERLTEYEVKRLVNEYPEADRTDGENRRWSRTVTSIIELCGRFFSVDWEEGLTESQENSYSNQPYEVEKCTYEKTIKVTEWEKL